MLLRGVDCDLRKLPTIQLNNVENTKVEEGKIKSKTVENNIALKISRYIDKLLNTGEYEMIEHFIFQKKILENRLIITLTEDRQYCNEDNIITEYTLEVMGNHIVVTNNNDKCVLCKSGTDNMLAIIKFLLSCICIVNKSQHRSIIKADDLPELYSNAFEYYSGSSNNIDDILRDADEKFADKMFAAYSMIHAALMNKVYNHNKLGNTIYNGYLFRGEREITSKSRIENSFSSLTYSIETAYQFAKSKDKSRILAFKDLKMSDLVEMRDIAVAIINEEASEQEVLLRASVQIDVHNKIGEYKGVTIYLANAKVVKTEVEEKNHLIQSFMKEYNNNCIYGLGQIIKNEEKINSIKINDDYETMTVYTKKASKFDVTISDTDELIIDGREVRETHINNTINSLLEN